MQILRGNLRKHKKFLAKHSNNIDKIPMQMKDCFVKVASKLPNRCVIVAQKSQKSGKRLFVTCSEADERE